MLITRSPQKKLRLELPRPYLDESIKTIKEYIVVVPAELLFSIGEIGFSD
jgi:hypothetical protein